MKRLLKSLYIETKHTKKSENWFSDVGKASFWRATVIWCEEWSWSQVSYSADLKTSLQSLKLLFLFIMFKNIPLSNIALILSNESRDCRFDRKKNRNTRIVLQPFLHWNYKKSLYFVSEIILLFGSLTFHLNMLLEGTFHVKCSSEDTFAPSSCLSCGDITIYKFQLFKQNVTRNVRPTGC